MSFFRSTSEISATPAEAVPPVADPAVGGSVQHTSEILSEAILASSSRVRDSLPKEHRTHFETLRQEIIDFAQARGIPKDALAKPNALREAASKLSTPDLQRLATLLERFEYLLVHKEPREEIPEALEYTEKFYHLKEQYNSQVEFLEEVGILESGTILGIDGYEYPIPTLEQIATRLFERRKELFTKHDQGFTKLLLVPFGMSLDILRETLKQFLLTYKKDHQTFDLNTDDPLWTWENYQGADVGDCPNLVYYPMSFDKHDHQGKTKAQILEERKNNQAHFLGWTVQLFQPSNPTNPHSPGFALIPRQGQGTPQGDKNPRPPLEAGKTPMEYLSLLLSSKDNKDSPYFQESSLTPEDWIIAFMLHLQETGEPLDNIWNLAIEENANCLTGAFFPSSVRVPFAYWFRTRQQVRLGRRDIHNYVGHIGIRSSVVI